MRRHLIMASAQSFDALHRLWQVSVPGPDGAPTVQGTRRLLLGTSDDVEARALPSKGRISVKHGARSVQVGIAVCGILCAHDGRGKLETQVEIPYRPVAVLDRWQVKSALCPCCRLV
jgi:hypothetical protein